MNKDNVMVLKVGGTTVPGSLKTAIVGHLRAGRNVYMDTIGVAANYIATKAIILAKGYLSTVGETLQFNCIFFDCFIGGEEDNQKTGIRWILNI